MDTKDEQERMVRLENWHRLIYNSIKHSGKKGKPAKKASNDLIFSANLKEESMAMLDHTINDYIKIPFVFLEQAFGKKFSYIDYPEDLRDLLQSTTYGGVPCEYFPDDN